jgi:hypothetical protein
MNEKITRRVNRLTTFFSFFIISFELSITDVLKTKNLSARAKLKTIKTTKMMTNHSIGILTRNNYDN